MLRRLAQVLDGALAKLANSPVALPFSGGLDSSLFAWLAKKYTTPKLYVVGVNNAWDLEVAEESSQLLDLPLIKIMLTEVDLEPALRTLIRILETKNPVHLSFKLPIFFVAKHAREHKILSTEGADELFAGYAKYLKMELSELEKRLTTDVMEVKNRNYDEKLCSWFGKSLVAPWLEPQVIEYALSLPIKLKLKGSKRKFLLREFATTVGLPNKLVRRKKKAAQYGSGVMSALKKLARREGLSLAQYLSCVE